MCSCNFGFVSEQNEFVLEPRQKEVTEEAKGDENMGVSFSRVPLLGWFQRETKGETKGKGQFS